MPRHFFFLVCTVGDHHIRRQPQLICGSRVFHNKIDSENALGTKTYRGFQVQAHYLAVKPHFGEQEVVAESHRRRQSRTWSKMRVVSKPYNPLNLDLPHPRSSFTIASCPFVAACDSGVQP
jgi:hypothetical protein